VEVLAVMQNSIVGSSTAQPATRSERPLKRFHTRFDLARLGTSVAIVIAASVVGVASTLVDSLYAVRLALGLPLVLALLRFPYALLLVWSSTGVFMGSALPVLSGNNLNTALTIPTLLLMFVLPVKQALKRMFALALLVIYLLWVLASIGFSPLDAGTFLKEWALYLDYAAIAILTITMLTTRRRMVRLVDTILAVSAFVAVWGICTFPLHQFAVLDPTTGQFRSTGIFTSAPEAALFLSLALPLALYRALTTRRWARVAACILCVILLVEIGLTFTRAAFLAIPFSIAVMALFLPSRRMKIGLMGGIAAVGILAVGLASIGDTPLFARFLNGDLGTFNGRTYLWNALLSRFDPTHVLGNGLHASDALLTKLAIGVNGYTANGSIANSPSNLYVGTLYDHGIVGVVLLTLVFLALFASLMARMRAARSEHRVLLAAVLAVLVSTLVQSVDQNDFWDQSIGVYFWIIMALPFALHWSRPQPPRKPEGVATVEAAYPHTSHTSDRAWRDHELHEGMAQ
jgi:O-antigen ligase